jgi:Tetratricopeptide repeat
MTRYCRLQKLNNSANDVLPSTERYARFNLAVALFRSGSVQEACQLLAELGEAETHNEEQRALRDKSHLTLAYHYLGMNDFSEAQHYFEKIRLQRPLSNSALFGLGRSYAAQQQYKKSLRPWLPLIKQAAHDPAVQQAMLAVPFVLSKLKAYKQSLQYCQKAIEAFQDELQVLEKAKLSLAEATLLASAGGNEALSELSTLPGKYYLWPLFSSIKLQHAAKKYRQLQMASQRLQNWTAQVKANTSLSQQQRINFIQKNTALSARVLKTQQQIQAYINDMLQQQLSRQQQRLLAYSDEAKFSLAQVYDYAANSQGEK